MNRIIRIVSPDGELDISTVRDLDRMLGDVPAAEHLVIDLGRVSFVDSVTLSRFVLAARRHQEAGGAVILANAQSAVRRVLTITQLDSVLPYAADVDAARSLVGSLDPN